MVGGELQPLLGPLREADRDHPVCAGGIQDGQGMIDHGLDGVGVGCERAVGAAVARPVEGDDPTVARQVGDLRLPEPAVDDGPGRQQQHRRRPVAEHLVANLHPVALDVPLGVRLSRPHRGFPSDRSAWPTAAVHGLASNPLRGWFSVSVDRPSHPH